MKKLVALLLACMLILAAAAAMAEPSGTVMLYSSLKEKQLVAVKEAFEAKKFDVSWNFGFGLQFFRKVQVAASYGLGLSKSLVNKAVGSAIPEGDLVNGKNRFWTITAAYLF